MNVWESRIPSTTDTEIKARMIGVQTTMRKLSFLFGCLIGAKILSQTDILSKTLQSPELCVTEAQQCANGVVKMLKKDHCEEEFDLFWKKIEEKKSALEIDEYEMPRKRSHPKCMTDYYGYVNQPDQDFMTEKDMFRAYYFQCYDIVINAIEKRFDQPDYKMHGNMETIVTNAVSSKSTAVLFDEQVFTDGSSFRSLYADEIDMDKLEFQMKILPALLHVEKQFNFRDVLKSIRSISYPMRTMITEVVKLIKLILLAPASNAEGERVFSGLRRIKTYLRSTMKQDRLNDLMLIHVHKDKIDSLPIIDMANEFISRNQSRVVKFGHFRQQDARGSTGETRSIATQTIN